MQYWMLRLFLSDRYRGTLFENPGRGPESGREDFLRHWFGSEIRFVHRRKPYVYTPFPAKSDARYLSGLIAREHTVTIVKPPEQAYEKQDVPDWDTANVFIDVSGEADGQKVAMQDNVVIGNPLAVIQSLVQRINSDSSPTEWVIIANAISSETGFWEAAQEYQGRISEIDLVFAAPNIWNGESETERALRELHNQNAVDVTEVKLKNTSGQLNPGTNGGGGRLAFSIDYIRRGGGAAKIKSNGKIVYDSETSATKHSPAQDIPVQDAESVAALALARWLLSRQ